LPFQDHLAGTGAGYIVVAKLVDYYRFVCDDEGNLRRYLFDSNVRDYLGANKVNEDIAASLEDDVVPDFWWLNNGITILTTRAIINGKSMLMQDIQVVNGLQTTETIYRHFNSGSRKSLDRTLSIKIIVALLNLGWVSDIWVEGSKVELARDEKDHGPHGIEPGVPARLAFGGLEQPIDGLDEPACLT
jgi:AIPR protein